MLVKVPQWLFLAGGLGSSSLICSICQFPRCKYLHCETNLKQSIQHQQAHQMPGPLTISSYDPEGATCSSTLPMNWNREEMGKDGGHSVPASRNSAKVQKQEA